MLQAALQSQLHKLNQTKENQSRTHRNKPQEKSKRIENTAGRQGDPDKRQVPRVVDLTHGYFMQ